MIIGYVPSGKSTVSNGFFASFWWCTPRHGAVHDLFPLNLSHKSKNHAHKLTRGGIIDLLFDAMQSNTDMLTFLKQYRNVGLRA